MILDAPATGHGLDMLRVPKVILEVAPAGILRRDAELAWDMFRDEKRAGVVVVTLPEDMPVNETIELATSLETELGLPIVEIVVNGVLPPIFSADERASLLVPRDLPSVPGSVAVAAGVRRAWREQVQSESLARLRQELKAPKVFLPHLFDRANDESGLRELAKRL